MGRLSLCAPVGTHLVVLVPRKGAGDQIFFRDWTEGHTARALAPSTALPRRSHARAWTDAMAARERERLRQAELESDRLREELETVANHLAHERAERERDAARWRARESAANDRERLARTRIAALEVRA